jgi:rod shape-determining protein MreD
MNKRRLRIALALLLLSLQILVNIHLSKFNINIDFIFLILIYITSRGNFLKSMLAATLIGWATDILSGHILGVYGFARVIVTFLIFEIIVFIDFKRLSFTFIFVFASLSLSNLIANLFFLLIRNFGLSSGLLIYQPLLTGMFAVLLITSDRIKEAINVY